MKGIILNHDSTSPFYGVSKGTCTVEDIYAKARQFEGTHVTDIMIGLNDSCVNYPSKKVTSFIDKYYQKVENGKPVDYSESEYPKSAKYVFEDLGVDMFEIQINEYRKCGINPWLSFRMNDFHCKNLETCWVLDDFFHEHPEYRREKFHPEFSISNADFSYDYAYEEVRRHYLDMMDEALERYDAYGIELDWMREIELFAIGREHEGIAILNGFMREVDSIINKHEKIRGHEIKCAVRVAPDIQTNIDFGLDVMKWVQEGIVDLVAISGRFESIDTDMPIKLWKTLLTPYNVMLAAGMDYCIRPSRAWKEPLPNSIESRTAFAASAYSQGADKVYFFNSFYTDVTTRFDKTVDIYSDEVISGKKGGMALGWAILNRLGNPDEVMKMKRRHIISMKDKLPLWKINTSHLFDNWESRGVNQLPYSFRHKGSFKITVGDIPEGAEVILRFAADAQGGTLDTPPRVFVNSELCEYIGTEKDEKWSRSDNTLCYRVPEAGYGFDICPYIIVQGEITEKSMLTVNYVDVVITPKK